MFHALEDKSVPAIDKPPEVFLASEIIRDFLQYLQLDNTHSVFMEEIGQPPEVAIDRAFIASEVGLYIDGGDKIPLLFHMIKQLMNKNHKHSADMNSTCTEDGSVLADNF